MASRRARFSSERGAASATLDSRIELASVENLIFTERLVYRRYGGIGRWRSVVWLLDIDLKQSREKSVLYLMVFSQTRLWLY